MLMKKLFTSILIALSLLICNELSAQETVKHIVQKGETISSIATNYGVTVAEITTLNPKAAKYLFVGMELQVPVKNKPAASAPASSSTTAVNSSATASVPVTQQTQTSSYTSGTTEDNTSYADAPYENQQSSTTTQSNTVGHLIVGYDLSLKEKPENTSVWGASFLFSTDTYLTDMFYVGLGAGMSFGGSSMKYESYKYTATAFNIMIPIYFGVTPIEGLDIDTGPSFNWLVGGGMKEFDGSKKIGETKYNDIKDLERFSPTWKVSVRLAKYIHVGVNIGLKEDSGTSMTFGLCF